VRPGLLNCRSFDCAPFGRFGQDDTSEIGGWLVEGVLYVRRFVGVRIPSMSR
jgi:hypothetical protein